VKEKQKDSEYFYSMINADIESSLSYEQRKEIKSILKRAVGVPSEKIIDYLINFWFIRRLYLTFFLGTDLRTKERIQPYTGFAVLKFFVSLILLLFLIFVIMTILFSLLYTIKSAFGIDFIPEAHLRDMFSYLY
jgi:hypothetical protein